MYINDEWYLCIDINLNKIEPDENWFIPSIYIVPERVTKKYKVNTETGLFEEVEE